MPSLIDYSPAALRSLLRPSSTTDERRAKLSGAAGYVIRRKDGSDDERHVLRLLRGVSMGAGVLPPPPDGRAGAGAGPDGELTYMRARVERVVGSRDSEAFYMINPDDGGDNASRGGDSAPELSIFFVRNK
ncbi:protein MIZU-KUSSEI 1-like [Panicum miliaceum]|uniref:Protein MIZU-KUSSEI 1-like n=1 Tax=Panicum miliaceum TaxID=4540 RepID=A0A3L6PR90_PANMI|nr:protein MIZU-KUSSEI 1-like [Panicum miliaceum]